MLANFLIPQLDELLSNVIFQQDGGPPHHWRRQDFCTVHAHPRWLPKWQCYNICILYNSIYMCIIDITTFYITIQLCNQKNIWCIEYSLYTCTLYLNMNLRFAAFTTIQTARTMVTRSTLSDRGLELHNNIMRTARQRTRARNKAK